MISFLLDNKEKCTGCTACMASCPQNCISMIRDKEGFLYPVADNRCISCGKCEKVCPQKTPVLIPNQIEKRAFAAKSIDYNIWERSASGGAFSEICRAWDNDNNTVIFGAKWNGLKVETSYVEGFSNISPLCKSKYIQSDINNTFKLIEKFLKDNRKVLFCGTPCQVAGLRHYLGQEFDNLFLVDLICHGVGSPTVFLQCIYSMEKELGASISNYSFRSKSKSFGFKQSPNRKNIELLNDPFIQLFLSQKCLRPSCGKNCLYRTEMRQGDITVADFKNLTTVFPSLSGEKMNYSTIVVNTEKGNSIIDRLKKYMIFYECKMSDVKEHNPLFYRQTTFADDRDVFFEHFIIDPQQAILEYTVPAQIKQTTFKRILWSNLPSCFRKTILRLLHQESKEPEYSNCSTSLISVESNDFIRKCYGK